MQRPTTTSRFSDDDHRIIIPPEPCDVAAAGDLLLYSRTLKKEHSRSIMQERLIHGIPLFLILCFILLWFLSRPVDLVTNNGLSGVQGNGTLPIMLELDHPLVDFSMLKPVYTSQASTPQNQNTLDANGSAIIH